MIIITTTTTKIIIIKRTDRFIVIVSGTTMTRGQERWQNTFCVSMQMALREHIEHILNLRRNLRAFGVQIFRFKTRPDSLYNVYQSKYVLEKLIKTGIRVQ